MTMLLSCLWLKKNLLSAWPPKFFHSAVAQWHPCPLLCPVTPDILTILQHGPIRYQNPGHVIKLDQSEASIRVPSPVMLPLTSWQSLLDSSWLGPNAHWALFRCELTFTHCRTIIISGCLTPKLLILYPKYDPFWFLDHLVVSIGHPKGSLLNFHKKNWISLSSVSDSQPYKIISLYFLK